MLRLLFTFLLLLMTTFSMASEPKLRDYDEYRIPAGYHIPIMSWQEFSTAYTEEFEELSFVTTNDIYILLFLCRLSIYYCVSHIYRSD